MSRVSGTDPRSLTAVPPDTVTGEDPGGRSANRLDQATIAHPPGHKTAKTISASNADAESKEPDPVNTADFPGHREVSMPPFRQARRVGPGPKAGTLSTFALPFQEAQRSPWI
jgi:hypothetical protein